MDVTQAALRRAKNYTDLSRISYLVADQSKFTRDLLNQALRNFSATDVREAPDFTTALNMIRERLPEVIFLGLDENWVDVQKFLKALRNATRPLPYIPTIILSHSASAEDVVIAIALGADDYITVPFSVATVETHLLTVLKGDTPHRLHR